MTRQEFTKQITDNVQLYIDNFYRFKDNPQIRINPSNLAVTLENGSDLLSEIGESDEALEDAAAAEGAANEDSTDFQVKQNPDFYAVASLVKVNDGNGTPDAEAIERIVTRYFK